jgi:hypothetical protein
MFIELPKKFDSNELFILAVLLLVLTVFAFLPKRFTKSQVVFIIIFNFFLGVVVDQILAVPPYDFYDIMDKPKMDIMDLIIYTFLYPLTAYFFFFLSDVVIKKNRAAIALMIIGWSSFVLGLEWLASQFGVYNYKEWSYILSAFSYLIIFSLNTLVLFYIKNVQLKTQNKNEPV